jgi:DNA-binding response OmpR family regulator
MDRSQLPAAGKFIGAGATDFILADTDKDEASWRLHAALLRTPAPEPPPKPIPGVTLDWKQHAVVMGDIRVSLTLRELQLVDAMLQSTTPIPALALAQKAWGRVPSGSANLVSVCVCNLRKKLARFGSAFGIRTHRGAGYSAEVRRS